MRFESPPFRFLFLYKVKSYETKKGVLTERLSDERNEKVTETLKCECGFPLFSKVEKCIQKQETRRVFVPSIQIQKTRKCSFRVSLACLFRKGRVVLTWRWNWD